MSVTWAVSHVVLLWNQVKEPCGISYLRILNVLPSVRIYEMF